MREGGVMSQPTTEINIEALPMEVPESIEVDVSGMSMGDTLRLEDLAGDRGRHVPRRPAGDRDRDGDRTDARDRAEPTEEELEEAAAAEAGEEGAAEGAARPPRTGEAAGESGSDEG